MSQLNLHTIKELLIEANKAQTAELKTELDKVNQRYDRRLKSINTKINKLQTRSLALERKARKNNIIIFGLDKVENEILLDATLGKVNELLGTDFALKDVNNIYTIGHQEKPPVVIEFISYLKKSEIFRSPEKLRALKGTHIVITHDLCERDREEQKVLRKHHKIAKDRNQEARIRGNKLIIGQKSYTAAELESDWETTSGSENEDSEVHSDVEVDEEEASPHRCEQKLTRRKAHLVSSVVSRKSREEKKRRSPVNSPNPQTSKTTRDGKKKNK